MMQRTSRLSGIPRIALAPPRPPKPAQFEPIPSDHAVSIIDCAALLASETAKRLSSMQTTTANDARCDVGPGLSDGAELPKRVAVVDGDEMPRLAVHAAGVQVCGFDDPSPDLGRHRLVLVLADGEQGSNCLEDFHEGDSFRLRIIASACESFPG